MKYLKTENGREIYQKGPVCCILEEGEVLFLKGATLKEALRFLEEEEQKVLNRAYNTLIKAGLSKEVAEKATLYCQIDCLLDQSLLPAQYVETAPGLLFRGFPWRATPEGHEYWANIREELCNK